MEDKAKCGHPLCWFGCYRGAYDLLDEASMAHPAKMAPALCFRILQHLEELGLIQKGKDTILDPMAGTGMTNLCAGTMGYPSISVELEEKFVNFQKKNKEYAERRFYRSLNWTMVKGDSRRLSELLTGNALKSITSPPYQDTVLKDGQRLASNRDIHWREWDRGTGYNKENPDNIGNLKDTPLKSITSHPYQDSQGYPSLGSVNKDDWGKEGKDIVKRRGLSGEYAKSDGQVGNLKSITSPPYEESLPNGLDRKAAEQMVQAMYDKHGRTYSKEDFEYQVELILKRSNREYGESDGQIGKLKDKPLKSIVSPPYGESIKGGKSGIEWQEDWGKPSESRQPSQDVSYSESKDNIGNLPDKLLKSITSPPYANRVDDHGIDQEGYKGFTDKLGVYGESEGQIGHLKDNPLKSIVSPPYGDAEKRDRSKEASNEKEKGYPRGDHNISAGYQGSDDNIGKLDGKPLKSVMSPPYEGGGHHKGMLDSWGGANTPVSDKTKDDHGYGNTEGQVEKAESYLSAMEKVYSEIAKVSDVLCVVVKCPTRQGHLRRLDLDTISILQESGWRILCQHRALLFEELEQANMFDGTTKKVKGRLSFFKRLAYIKGQPVASWEDIIIAVRK